MKRNENVIPNASTLTAWRKSSYSGGSSGNCVEVSGSSVHCTPVRDSKRPQGPAVLFGTGAWTAFVSGVKDGAL